MNEKKEIKISLTTFIVGIIAIVLLILVIVMGMYIATGNNKGQTKTEMPDNEKVENVANNVQENNKKAELLDTSSELVQELYNCVISEWSNLNADMVGDFDTIMYVNGKSTRDTISNDTKLLTVIEKMIRTQEYTVIKQETLPQISDMSWGENTYEYRISDYSYWYNYDSKKWEYKNTVESWDGTNEMVVADDIKVFDIETIQKIAKEIFNEELKMEKHSYNFLGEALIYDKGEYRLITYEGGGGTAWYCYNSIIRAEKEENEIAIYDYYLAFCEEETKNSQTEGSGYGNHYITKNYTALDKKKEIVSLKELNSFGELMNEKNGEYELNVKKAKEEYGITLPIYKHTFKQAENGNYYWVSTELTNY